MRKSSQRSSQIETFEKMLLMSASAIDGVADVDFLEGSNVDEVQASEFPVPFGESVFADIPEATPEPLSSNDAFLDRVVELTNEVRTASGLQALTVNSTLQITAQLQSVNMAEQDFFSHTGQDGLMAWDRALNEGYNYQTIGENIAAGQLTPEEVVQGWVNSPGHLANILNPRFSEIGVGYQYLQSDTGVINYHHYWTQVFGTEFPSAEEPVIVETPEHQEPVEENSAVDVPPASVDVESPMDSVEPVTAAEQPGDALVPPAPPAAAVDLPAVEAETSSVAVDDDMDAVGVTPALDPAVNVAPPAPPVEPQPETVKVTSNDTTSQETTGIATPAPVAEVTPANTTDKVATPEALDVRTEDRATTVVTTEVATEADAPPTKATPPATDQQIVLPEKLEPARTVDSSPAIEKSHPTPVPQVVAEQVVDAIARLTETRPVAIQQRVAEITTRLTNMAEVNFFVQAAQHQLELSGRSQVSESIGQMINGRFTAQHSWLDNHNTGRHSHHSVNQILDGFRVEHESADDNCDQNNECELTADSLL